MTYADEVRVVGVVEVRQLEGLVGDAISDDGLDVAVGQDGGGASKGGEDGGSLEGRHFCWL
jgi:hypothetical protein